MNLPRGPILLIVLIALLVPGSTPAQERIEYSEHAEALFKQGLAQFIAGSYHSAAIEFDEIIRNYPFSHRITAAYIMKGKSLLRANENYDAARTLKLFMSRFPTSLYTPDAELMLGIVYQRIERYEEAAQSFLAAWARRPLPDRLRNEIVEELESTIDRNLALATLERVLASCSVADERAFLWLKVAEKDIAQDNIPAALVALDTLARRYPGNSFGSRVAAMQSHLAARSAVKIAALLPLMRTSEPSAMKEVGNEVFDGALFAVEQSAADPASRMKVAMDVKDTNRDPKLAEKEAQELGDDKEVIGVIGPVFSATTPPAAVFANARGLPLVSPTANANGIAAIGPCVFQANPDYETRGRAMARYAVVQRGMKVLAVLAPSDSYGKFLAEGFIAEATRLGARVAATEWYQRGASDLKVQLAAIRRTGMIESESPSISFAGKLTPGDKMRLIDLGVPPKRIDSLTNRASIISVAQLLGPLSRSRIDSLRLQVVYDETKVDSLQYPVTGIQGLYLPISSPEEIGVVASQVVYFNFQTQMLGSGEWYNFSELNASKRYCQGVIFESDTFVDSNSVSYRDFVNAYLARFKKLPSKNTLFGYDTANLVLSLIHGGAATRPALQRALAGVHEFQGLHSKIGFTPGRVNGWLSVLQYRDDTIGRIGEVSVDQPPPLPGATHGG